MNIFDWLAKNTEWLFSGVAVAVPIALFGWFFSRKAKTASETDLPKEFHSVTSHNQSGGITAHTVNVQEIRRTFPGEAPGVRSLADFSGTSAYLHRYTESSEVNSFCKDMVAVLNEFGWSAMESAHHIGDSSVENVVLEINETPRDGDRSQIAATCLQKMLTEQGLNVVLNKLKRNPLPDNSMYLRVGPIRA